MGLITFRHRGNFNKTEKFLNKVTKREYLNILDLCGQMGVDALAAATPKDSGRTASSWSYEIERNSNTTSISWLNTNENKGVIIAIILQYGHGTGTGGYVQGQDYINPAMKPVFDKIAEMAWKEVTSS
jgi:hypothetical protein